MAGQESKDLQTNAVQPQGALSRVESVTKIIGIVGALIAAGGTVFNMAQTNAQDARELRWKQAALAREMVNKMIDDRGWKAMLMLDWQEGRTFEFAEGHKPERILPRDVLAAMTKVAETREPSEKERYIVDQFDRLFLLVSQLESAARSDLVKRDDVRFPLSWYVTNRFCDHKQLLAAYMTKYSAPEALHFFESLEEWKKCGPAKE